MAPNRWGGRLCSLGFVLVLLGCGETDLPVSPTRPPQPFDEVKTEISRLRGLPFLREVALETKNREEIGSLSAEPVEDIAEEKSSLMAEIYQRLGLLTDGADFSKDLVELQLFRHSVYYDGARQKIVVPQEPLKPARAFLRFPGKISEETTKQLLLAHALAHALQDQHFQWRARIRSRNTQDSRLPLHAVMQGDAILVGLAYLAARKESGKEQIVDAVKSLFRASPAFERELSVRPDLLRQKLAFEYLYGSQFVLWAYSHKGWDGVNRLFLRPPVSTAQILHPEKYYVKREEPLRIIPWKLLRQSGAQKIDQETLGEFTLRLLLAQTAGREEAEKVAAGWLGDTLLALRNGDELILGWVIAWESQAGAREFLGAYRRVLERRYGPVFDATSAGNDTLVSREGAHPLLLQIKDNFVFVLDGMPAPRSIEVAAGLWDELETTRDAPQIPFDQVRRSQGLASFRK
ncbi:MAG: hypothetical protein HYV04_14110 [Deltaproteobacteria bacterium]|nr:hypothetical protein [Deltaproteobacteria bacterium]